MTIELNLHSKAAVPSKRVAPTLTNLSINPQQIIASFLKPTEILAAGRACKTLNQNLSIDSIWKQALQRDFPPRGLKKQEFLQLHQDIQNGRFRIKDLDLGSKVHYISRAHLDSCSNAYIQVSKKNEDEWSVHDQFGDFVCKPDIIGAKMYRTCCNTALLTQDTLLLWYTTFPKQHIALFSRKDGSFLHRWSSPLPNENLTLEALYPESRQMVLCNPWGTGIYLIDFAGKLLAQYKFTEDQLPCFSKEARSLFYLLDNKLWQQPLIGKAMARFETPPSYRPNKLLANDQIISTFTEGGEIRIWDYKTGQPLSVIPAPNPESGKRLREASLVGDKLRVVLDLLLEGVESILYDKHGKQLICIPKAKLPVCIFSVLEHHLLCHRDFSYHLYNSTGLFLHEYPHLYDVEPYVKSLNRNQFALCSKNRVRLVDYLTSTPDEGKKN